MQTDRMRSSIDPGAGRGAHGVSVKCDEALYWGTMGGAKACGLDHKIGSLTPGKVADIVLHRADGISMVGWDRRNPAAALVMQSNIHTTDTVLVEGRIAKYRGTLTGEARRATRLLQEASDYIYEQADRLGGFAKAAQGETTA
jgi:cytosine/adenosine deaminase-related metal-dependent hydrolase